MTYRIAIVGLGKIAQDQHIPAIATSDRFELVAAATHAGHADGIALFRTVDELLAADLALDAVAMCQPPQARFEAAAKAIRAGKHVLLEKPPGATLAEVEALTRLSDAAGTTLFAAWHSRYAPGVADARAWLTERRVNRVEIVWKEDVRRWHPGQQWIWEPGGLGVFDPGINALSIATLVLPRHFFLKDGTLEIPANRAAPIAAELHMVGMSGAPVHAVFDWRQTGPQTWDITVETDDGTLRLSHGGSKMTIDGVEHGVGPEREYPGMYAHFARLIEQGRSDVDRAPLRLVADAFLRCRQVQVDAFED
ncbi:L-arabinose 1-dehydrogenase (NAD(P)(+)) [Sphingomonas sp. EC-HK361]|jgi:predicted dehydrogenase|uniref:Gfo/Idh/MocA family protein n=1 Tax=Sphingomonas sp. EC-HK361 TaxID=2038397 RepID=UPI0012565C58|nr:Gfo/Idh/MocA family oxidoreductase [Sphingomonas sp. EC-HK361]VVT14983.1 L-arabinose 1-dehydrogenase (NAD(P)(+)) [Sphingomonas sp. EC-HK361]